MNICHVFLIASTYFAMVNTVFQLLFVDIGKRVLVTFVVHVFFRQGFYYISLVLKNAVVRVNFELFEFP